MLISNALYDLVDQCIEQLIQIKKSKRSRNKTRELLFQHVASFSQLKQHSLSPDQIQQIRYKYFSRPWEGLAPLCCINTERKEEARIFFDTWAKAARSYVTK